MLQSKEMSQRDKRWSAERPGSGGCPALLALLQRIRNVYADQPQIITMSPGELDAYYRQHLLRPVDRELNPQEVVEKFREIVQAVQQEHRMLLELLHVLIPEEDLA